MSGNEASARAIEWLEAQLTELASIRNAAPRDPSFKNWRQATLTLMQRIWPGDQNRSDRFRRIPFSPVDPRADSRAVREMYSRGCQEAARVLNGFIAEIRAQGVPDAPEGSRPPSAEIEFEDGLTKVELPAGDLGASSSMGDLAENMLADLADTPPQGTDPAFDEPSRAHIAPPAASEPDPKPVRRGLGVKARLRDLLGLANQPAKTTPVSARAGDPAAATPAPTAKPLAAPTPSVADALEVLPLGDPVEAATPPHATLSLTPTEPPAMAPVAPLSAAPPATPQATPATPQATPATEKRAAQLISPPSRSGEWPLPGLFAKLRAQVSPAPPSAGAEPPVENAGAPPAQPRSKTLRGNIEKVSIESLISPEFRDAADPTVELPASQAPDRPEWSEARDTPAVQPAGWSGLTVVPPPAGDDGFEVTPPSIPSPVDVHPMDEDEGDRSVPDDEAGTDPDADALDAEAFARAAEDFMRTSPVLAATPVGKSRSADEPEFDDADAIAVSSMVQQLERMDVPRERRVEARARLMDLARRLERGDLDWSALRRAVWFAMEYPELARRLLPVLLPWIDRAA